MRRPREAWRRELKLWLPALVFFLLNVGVLSAYRFLLAGEAQLREQRIEESQAELQQLDARLAEVKRLVRRVRRNRRAIERFYGNRLGSEAERFTSIVAEVKDLAKRAGLEPTTIRYPDEELGEYGLVKRSIVFGVSGRYGALRRLINFLELTDSFLTLEEIRPSEAGGKSSALRINLRISTLFLEEGVDPSDLAARRRVEA